MNDQGFHYGLFFLICSDTYHCGARDWIKESHSRVDNARAEGEDTRIHSRRDSSSLPVGHTESPAGHLGGIFFWCRIDGDFPHLLGRADVSRVHFFVLVLCPGAPDGGPIDVAVRETSRVIHSLTEHRIFLYEEATYL